VASVGAHEKAALDASSKPSTDVLLLPKQADAIAQERIEAWLHNPIDVDTQRKRSHKERFGSVTRILDLEGLKLTTLPEQIRHLPGLENLNLGHNRLSELPAWIGELDRLKGLNLEGNRLKRLPDEIGNLRALRVLWIKNNDLRELPKVLLELPLKELELYGNRRLQLPESLAREAPDEALRYYFEARTSGGAPLRELKLLLVGRGKAGKTTLIKRLAGDAPDENESETHSISIRELILECPRGSVRTRAWDFGGQEILHSTHQFFLTERSLYLLVLEPRTGLAQRDAEYWLKLIETQGAGSPVILVLNWSHGRTWRIDEVKLRRKFPSIAGIVSIDAFFGDGLDELRVMLANVVHTRMKDVWLPFPKRWREIKDDVAGMTSNFLTYDEYTDLCIRFGERRPDAQADLAGILHALGLALYFGKDPRLHDTRVLNPGWVTGGVYAVIRSSSVMQNDGQLAASDMPRVLDEAEGQRVIRAADYPARTHDFILELMRAFQLCYASEEEKGKPKRYLVPELLPEFEPLMTEEWDSAPVRLRYRYEVLPPGLLPRFIVRTHALSDGAPHWRHGVVLRHAESQALIREESDRPELHVFALGGDVETRRVMVAIVRRELQVLHAEMRTQPVEELELSGEGAQWISVKALREVEDPDTQKQRLPIQPDGTAEVEVSRELDKLLTPEARAIDREPDVARTAVRMFVSYAHDDERQLKRLDSILDVIEQQYGLMPWRDKRLIAGEEWDEEIRARLEDMDIFLFIASAASMASPYIRDCELRRAKERRALGNVEMVAVKLEPCAYDDDPFLGKLQRLPSKFKSIAESSPRSAGWELVRKGLLPVIERVRRRKEQGAKDSTD
jgi:internalin A